MSELTKETEKNFEMWAEKVSAAVLIGAYLIKAGVPFYATEMYEPESAGIVFRTKHAQMTIRVQGEKVLLYVETFQSGFLSWNEFPANTKVDDLNGILKEVAEEWAFWENTQ